MMYVYCILYIVCMYTHSCWKVLWITSIEKKPNYGKKVTTHELRKTVKKANRQKYVTLKSVGVKSKK